MNNQESQSNFNKDNNEGVFYTPEPVSEFMKNISNKESSIIDPACGSGAFLATVQQQLELPLEFPLEKLFVPDRFDTLLERLNQTELKPFIVPVQETLEFLEKTVEDISVARRGAFWLMKGESGSGKTTFLNTVFLFKENIETISISNNESITDFLNNLKKDIDTKNKYQIIVIEGREAIADFERQQLEKDIHSINSFLRSDFGKSKIIVWNCNTEELERIIIELAKNIGGTALLGSNNENVYDFHGPSQQKYIAIAESTIATLNEGASLLDLGITEERANELLKKASNIGSYLQLVRQDLLKNKRKVKPLLKDKERCRMWVIVITGNDREEYISALTRGRLATADIARLMVATNANIVEDLKKIPEKIGILGTALDARIINIPIKTALAIAREYADEKLQEEMKKLKMNLRVKRENKTPNERLLNSELAKAFQNSSIGMGNPGQKPGELTLEAFKKLLSITQKNDTLVNKTIGEALVNCGLVNRFECEKDFGNGLTRRTDIVCYTDDEIVRLEVMWREAVGKADIANYTLIKIYNYGKALGFID